MESARRRAPPAPGVQEPGVPPSARCRRASLRPRAGKLCPRELRQVTKVEVATGRRRPGSEEGAGGWLGVAGQGRDN